jgi:dTDP-4-dehydrorhamnose 3,5-epimerase
MKLIPLALPGLILFEPKVFEDERGLFFESFRADLFTQATAVTANFVQDNQASSVQGVLRGLHYQVAPKAQGKLLRVVQGEIFDVAVDLRRSSANFGQWLGLHLSAANRQQLWIPEGFAHGYYTLSEHAQCSYKTNQYYAPEHERNIVWNDAQLAITWPLLSGQPPILSVKDRLAGSFANAELFA